MATVNELAVGAAEAPPSDAGDASVNIVVIATVMAIGKWLLPNVVPWWSIGAVPGIVLAAYAYAKSLAKDHKAPMLERWLHAVVVSRVTTVLGIAVIAAELAVLIIVPQLPAPIRIVPGPLLHQNLGRTHQTLVIEIEGKRYTLDDPRPGPFYVRTSRGHVDYLLTKEPEKVMASIVDLVFEPSDDEKSEAVELKEKWNAGSPSVMQETRYAGTASMLLDNGRARAVTLRKLSPRPEGIVTYEAELVD